MTRYLLDVNVRIALVDPAHVQHEEAHAGFSRFGKKASPHVPSPSMDCSGSSVIPSTPVLPGPPSAVVGALKAMQEMEGHEFWSDSLSLIDADFVDPALLSSHSRVTDSYLLALARAHGGRFVSMDTKLAIEVVADGQKFLTLI